MFFSSSIFLYTGTRLSLVRIRFFNRELNKVLFAKKYSFLGQYDPIIRGSIKKFGWFATKIIGPATGTICLFCIEI